jgi:hypothetical protein
VGGKNFETQRDGTMTNILINLIQEVGIVPMACGMFVGFIGYAYYVTQVACPRQFPY